MQLNINLIKSPLIDKKIKVKRLTSKMDKTNFDYIDPYIDLKMKMPETR